MQKKTISKDIPLDEITLRRYEKPGNSEGRDLVRKLCLSLGLLQPGDSRDVIVDIFNVMLKAKHELSADDVEDLVIEERKKHKLSKLGVTPPNIRRQLRRLKEMFLIENMKGNYRITENLSIKEIFDEKIQKFLLDSTIHRLKEYADKVDKDYQKIYK